MEKYFDMKAFLEKLNLDKLSYIGKSMNHTRIGKYFLYLLFVLSFKNMTLANLGPTDSKSSDFYLRGGTSLIFNSRAANFNTFLKEHGLGREAKPIIPSIYTDFMLGSGRSGKGGIEIGYLFFSNTLQNKEKGLCLETSNILTIGFVMEGSIPVNILVFSSDFNLSYATSSLVIKRLNSGEIEVDDLLKSNEDKIISIDCGGIYFSWAVGIDVILNKEENPKKLDSELKKLYAGIQIRYNQTGMAFSNAGVDIKGIKHTLIDGYSIGLHVTYNF